MNIKLIIASVLIIASHCTNTSFQLRDDILPIPSVPNKNPLVQLQNRINDNEQQILKQIFEKNLTKEQENELDNLIFKTLLLSQIAECVEKNPHKAGIFLNCFADKNNNNFAIISAKAINAKIIIHATEKEISEILS